MSIDKDLSKRVVKYYRRNIYGTLADDFLEWIPRNKTRILDLMRHEFAEIPLATLEKIMDDYYSDLA
ncbi:MAG: hypothetical protein ACTSWW_01355 [Promethearchaeota archaeon]